MKKLFISFTWSLYLFSLMNISCNDSSFTGKSKKAEPAKQSSNSTLSTSSPKESSDVKEELEQPEPQETEQPEPQETEQPEPQETEQPEPQETEQPEPQETEQPEPQETEQPEPQETEPDADAAETISEEEKCQLKEDLKAKSCEGEFKGFTLKGTFTLSYEYDMEKCLLRGEMEKQYSDGERTKVKIKTFDVKNINEKEVGFDLKGTGVRKGFPYVFKGDLNCDPDLKECSGKWNATFDWGKFNMTCQ